jgi:adenylylsulfate kinase
MAKVLWMMGPTSAGKTTLAVLLHDHLRAKGRNIVHIDGDEIRDMFGSNHGFQASDRLLVVKFLSYFATKAVESGADVLVSALTASEDARTYIRDNIPQLHIALINCPIEECAARDPKGLYGKAQRGEIDTLIGFNEPYILPTDPDIAIDTSETSREDAVARLADFLVAGASSN